MRVEFSGKNLTLTEALKARADKKIKKLERFTGPILSAHASFQIERHMHRVDLVVHCARERIYKATSQAEDMYAAINDATEAIEQQAQKHKTKRLAGRARGKAAAQPRQEPAEEEEEEDASSARRRPSITSRDDLYHPKPLRLSDAVLLLEESRAPLLVYQDHDSGSLAVLFKDQDSLSLVRPEGVK